MLGSLLIRLGMFALTIGVLLWIGWTVPQKGTSESDPSRGQRQHLHVERTETSATTAIAAATVRPSRTSERPKISLKSHTPEKLDLNLATEQDFESLPGIGSVLAGRIVGYRQGIGSFHSVEDLREVKGIGKKKFDRIRNLVHVTAPMPQTREGKKTT